jgi:hypothetical protein
MCVNALAKEFRGIKGEDEKILAERFEGFV